MPYLNRSGYIPTDNRFKKYESYGFEVIHNHIVNVNPLGENVEVDFSAADPDYIVRIAVKKAYQAGKIAGEKDFQNKLRLIMGL